MLCIGSFKVPKTVKQAALLLGKGGVAAGSKKMAPSLAPADEVVVQSPEKFFV
jgi:hypothetical protein